MKKWKQFLAGMVLVLAFSMLTACGCSTGNNANNTTNTENNAGTNTGTTTENVYDEQVNRTEIIEDTNTVNDTTEDGMLNDAGNAVNDVVDGVGEAGKDVINGVENGVDNLTGNDNNNTNNTNDTNNTGTSH